MQRYNKEPKEFEEKVIQISRVSKKTKGGNRIGFTALVVIGNKKGRVGVALGKAPDVLSAIKKGIRLAKKRLITISLAGNTIPHQVFLKKGAAKILIKPAPKGSGIIAGGPVRAIMEVAGVMDVVSKILGSRNKISNVYATYEALGKLRKRKVRNKTKDKFKKNNKEEAKEKNKTKTDKTTKKPSLKIKNQARENKDTLWALV